MERAGVIDSQLSEEFDGAGGGYGKYPGLSVAQVAERFRFLANEGEGRSVRAVLRIVHEQTEARGHLGTQRLLAILSGLATLGLGVVRVVSADPPFMLNVYFGVTAVVTVLFTIGAVTIGKTAKRNEMQLKEIRRLALLTLEILTSKPNFVARDLEREHVAALDSLKKVDPASWGRVRGALG